MGLIKKISVFCLCLLSIATIGIAQLPPKRSGINPLIIQDSRDLPQVDGTFGFLYRTEDGIAHGAVGDTNGAVHGRFTYTDPTGLKVNYNYNAGSRKAPSDYTNNPQPAKTYQQPELQQQPRQPAPQQRPRQPAPIEEPNYDYYEPPQPQRIAPVRRPAKPQNNVDYGSYSY